MTRKLFHRVRCLVAAVGALTLTGCPPVVQDRFGCGDIDVGRMQAGACKQIAQDIARSCPERLEWDVIGYPVSIGVEIPTDMVPGRYIVSLLQSSPAETYLKSTDVGHDDLATWEFCVCQGATPSAQAVAPFEAKPNPAAALVRVGFGNFTATVDPPAAAPDFDLSVLYAATANPAQIVTPFGIRLLVSNAGPNKAINVRVADSLPLDPNGDAATEVISLSPSQGTCERAIDPEGHWSDKAFSCELGTLQPGATVEIIATLKPKVETNPTTGPLINRVRVESPGAEPACTGVSDLAAQNDQSELRFAVAGAGGNRAPVTVDDRYSLSRDTEFKLVAPGVLGNDVDPEGGPLTSRVTISPSHGVLTMGRDGSFSYRPEAGFVGTDSFSYLASDGALDGPPAKVVLTVTPPNEAPVAAGDTHGGTEDNLLFVAAPGVLANDRDPNGDALQAELVGPPQHGTLSLNPDGSFRYQPAPEFSGADSFTYRATDGQAASPPVAVDLNIRPVNDHPTLTQMPDAEIRASGGVQSILLEGIGSGAANETQNLSFVANSATPAVISAVAVDYTSPGATGVLRLTPAPDADGVALIVVTLSDDGGTTDGGVDEITRVFHVTVTGLPTVGIVATAAETGEGSIGSGLITLRRSGPLTEPLSVGYTIGGTADNGTDYQAIGDRIEFPVGVAEVTIPITAIDDGVAEREETVVLSLVADAAYRVGFEASAVVRVSDDEPAAVSIEPVDTDAGEAGANAGRFAVVRLGDPNRLVGVLYLISGSAVSGTDYDAIGGSLALAPGQTRAFIDIVPRADNRVEGDETVTLSLAPWPDYVIASPSAATLVIRDDPAVVSLVANDGDAAEAGREPGSITVTRSGGNLAEPLPVDFTAGGSAENGVDLDALGLRQTIPAGQSALTLTVRPREDNRVEPDETFSLTLVPAVTYQAGTSSTAAVTIREDSAVVTVSATDAQAAETGDPGAFTFTRSGGALGQALSVQVALSGTGLNGTDFNAVSTRINIAAGQTAVTVPLLPRRDNLVEGDETVTLSIIGDSTLIAGTPDAATVILTDDPAIVDIEETDPEASEAGRSPGSVTLRRRGGNPAAALTVPITLSGSAAANGTDYDALGLNPTIPAGQSTVTVTVHPREDNLVEPDETVVIGLNPNGTFLAGTIGSGTVTIRENSAVVDLTASDAAASETGDPGRFTLTRSGGNLAAALTVPLQIGGSAANGGDYPALAFNATIPANQTSLVIPLNPRRDNLAEGDETVTLNLGASTAFVPGGSSGGTVVIADAPAIVTLTASDPSADETGGNPGEFTLTRSGGDLSAALRLSLNIGGTAINGNDYLTLALSPVIPANSTTLRLPVTPRADSQLEGTETVILRLLADPAYRPGTPDTATVTIDDGP